MPESHELAPQKRRSCLRAVLVASACLFLMAALFWKPVQMAREAARRATCIGQNKFFGGDMKMYEHKNGSYPPAYLRDELGRPAHSWRVLLLRESQELLQDYRLDQPWDSPHNRALADDAPIGMSGVYPYYHCASDRDSDPQDTSYVMVVGPETFSPGPTGRRETEFDGGLSDTIAVAEMSESGIPWMAPRDLDFETMSFKINDPQRKGLRSKHPGTFNVQFADGSATSLKEDIDPEVLKSLLKISGPKDYSWRN